jgi:hypothetical protein
MADMTRHLKPWLTDAQLKAMGGVFEDVIAAVTEEPIRNRFKPTLPKSVEPVISFEASGYRLVPNKSILQQLIDWFGKDSDDWIGRRVRIVRHCVETTNQQGQVRRRWQRAIACEDPHACFPVRGHWPAPAPVAPPPRAESELVPELAPAITADEIFGRRRTS